MTFLKENWVELTKELPKIKNDFYHKLFKDYSSKDRYYHNLNHIEYLLLLLNKYSHLLVSPQTVRFAIWYHDSIYDASKNNNEELSAELAKSHLLTLGVDKNIIYDCYRLILATKSHNLSDEFNSFDAQFLLDIDLSILAASKEQYFEYSKQIRQEYSIYSNELYNKGRKQVLQHFLNSKRIYKTNIFYEKNEKQARNNIMLELKHL